MELIDAKVRNVLDLDDYFFVVPDYQREYVWEADDQVDQFITDIDNEYDPNANKQTGYFIGSIIIVKNRNKFDVIDGQQRLTTIMLSLCAMRESLKSKESELDNKGKNYLKKIGSFLSDFDTKTDEDQMRLELQYEESNGYLEHVILDRPFTADHSPSTLKMSADYDQLKEYYNSIAEEGATQLVNNCKYFLTAIELVVIKSESLSSALKIFETINQRGVGLNAMDLVKNLLFSKAKESEFNKIKDIWKTINANLLACKEDNKPLRILRYFLMARYHDGIIREDSIYKWIISKDGKGSTNYENSPLVFAKELEAMSKRYSDLILATESLSDQSTYPAVTRIGFVNKYRSRQHLIMLLALHPQVAKSEIEYLASQLESFFFFSNSLKIQAKRNEALFTDWALKLRNKKTKEEIADVLRSSMTPYLQKLVGTFRSKFSTIRRNDYSPAYRERFILGMLENTLRLKSGLQSINHDFHHGKQVEHILPQTPKDRKIPDEFLDMEEYKNEIEKLGNTTLIESNINQALNKVHDLGGNWFSQKQSEYMKSDVLSACLLHHDYHIGKDTALNRTKEELAYSFREWNKDSITKRQAILLELAFETWKLNGVRLDKMQS